jgi:crotonobetainyl-CoA:carnitine CoA-transferase CaiB-like acyl-CoA transferase
VPEPLDGYRVVELSTGILGPLAGAYLAEMGAEVVKVEPPEGDLTRYVRGKGNLTPPETPGPMWLMSNRGKRSVSLDAFGELGREALARLVERADVLLTNFRPEALEALGLDDATVRARNPRLVYASGTGWGPVGPDADRMMVDGAAQARAGLSSVVGPTGGPPAMVGALVADTGGAMQLALGVVTTLLARERTGVAQRVDTSALGSQLWLQIWELTHVSLTGFEVSRRGPHHAIFGSSYGVYETADGASLFLGHLSRDEDWVMLCELGGQPALAADERWATTIRRIGIDPRSTEDDDVELQRHVAAIIKTRSLDEWMQLLSGRSEIIVEPVRSHSQVLVDDQVRDNQYVVPIEVAGAGSVHVIGNLVQLDPAPGSVKTALPALGEHNRAVLASIGYTDAEIDAVGAEAHEAIARRRGSLKFQPPDDATDS